MTYTENNIYWIITAQGKEYHYPKAIYSLPYAKIHLQKYIDEVHDKPKSNNTRNSTDNRDSNRGGMF